MKWLRFSIAGLMAFIIYVAIGLAAFSKGDDPTYGRLWNAPELLSKGHVTQFTVAL